MNKIRDKFLKLGVDFAPGQEGRHASYKIKPIGDKLEGTPVDFSHGDVNAFEPTPGTLDLFVKGVQLGAEQAYTEYAGKKNIREHLAEKLSAFTNVPVEKTKNLLITPGTQGALFLAMGSLLTRGDKVAIVEPDYFANRKLVQYFEAEICHVRMSYLESKQCAGIDLNKLEEAFKSGAKLFLFSNPNNPTGVVYSKDEINEIAAIANRYGAYVIADQLYARQIFESRPYTHLCGTEMNPDNLITIMGPSKTESLSGYRLGTAFGSSEIIERMEKLQAIVSLRAPGYNQAVLNAWFNEPEGWLEDRIQKHQRIRDDILNLLSTANGFQVRPTEAGSYLFPKFPELSIGLSDFVKILRSHANVIVTPGFEFGPQFTDSFRINFSQDHDAAINAIKRIIEMTGRYSR